MVFKNRNFMNYDSAYLHYFNSWIPGSDALPFRDGLPKKSTGGRSFRYLLFTHNLLHNKYFLILL